MHTPDGFLTSWVCVATLALAAGAVAYSLARVRKWMTAQKAVYMAAIAAVVFGLQMLNFSIGGGTSGHFVGGALAAILLGPEAAVLVLAAVLLVQTFVFGDGGVLAIGANILLMGVVAGYSAHYVYRQLKGRMPVIAGALASWASVVAASAAAAVLIGVSGTAPLSGVLYAMTATHMFIGIGEGIISGSVLLYISKTRQELLSGKSVKRLARYAALSAAGALAVSALALPFASVGPDGMEKVAISLGFFDKATEVYSLSPMPGYTVLGQETYLASLFCAVCGMAMVFGISYAIARPVSG